MRRTRALQPFAALAVALTATLLLAAVLLLPGRSTKWQVSPGEGFGKAAGGSVRLDQPAR